MQNFLWYLPRSKEESELGRISSLIYSVFFDLSLESLVLQRLAQKRLGEGETMAQLARNLGKGIVDDEDIRRKVLKG